jgi:hypothetical protein
VALVEGLKKCNNGKHLNNMRDLFLVDKQILHSDLLNFEEAIDRCLLSKK